MPKVIHGVVHGRTIELQEDPGVPEGQPVEIVLRVPSGSAWGEGLRRCAGALSELWTEQDDRILAEIARERKIDSRREIDE